jgi:hypothetical protein
VEFALTLLLFFLFFIAFMQLVMIFIGHERLSFATFTASRYYSIHDREAAEIMYRKIDPEAVLSIDPPYVILDKEIDVPLDFENIEKRGDNKFMITNKVKTFVEPHPQGDN